MKTPPPTTRPRRNAIHQDSNDPISLRTMEFVHNQRKRRRVGFCLTSHSERADFEACLRKRVGLPVFPATNENQPKPPAPPLLPSLPTLSTLDLGFDASVFENPEEVEAAVRSILGIILPEDSATKFAAAARAAYCEAGSRQDSPPYHNFNHALDVLQATLYISADFQLPPHERVALAIASLFHDAGHRGVSNDFLRQSESSLVSEFGRDSTQEYMHSSLACSVLMEDPDILPVEYREHSDLILSHIHELILSTDMSLHSELKARLQQCLDCYRSIETWPDPSDLYNEAHAKERLLIMKAILKAADLSNISRPWHISRAWSLRLSDEFLRQGDAERALGLQVTPFCDRTKFKTVAHSTSGFIDHVGIGWFLILAQISPRVDDMVESIRVNRGNWEKEIGTYNNKNGDDSSAK